MGRAKRRNRRLAKLAAQRDPMMNGTLAKANDTTKKTHVPYKPCHTGVKFVGKIGKTSLFAGKAQDCYTQSERFDLLMTADDTPKALTTGPLMKANSRATVMLPRAILNQPECGILNLGWKDGGVPALGRELFWEPLVEYLMATELRFAVGCLGGHGRTGTMLSILAALGGLVPEKTCPVNWIREHYCDEAVETSRQIGYIRAVTLRDVASEGSYETYYDKWDIFERTPGRYPTHFNRANAAPKSSVPSFRRDSNSEATVTRHSPTGGKDFLAGWDNVDGGRYDPDEDITGYGSM
jgi:hypothetical protein